MDHPVHRASAIVGSKASLAEKLGLRNPSVVSQWAMGYRKVPPKYCRKIESLTAGEVTAEQLRPDIFGKAAA